MHPATRTAGPAQACLPVSFGFGALWPGEVVPGPAYLLGDFTAYR